MTDEPEPHTSDIDGVISSSAASRAMKRKKHFGEAPKAWQDATVARAIAASKQLDGWQDKGLTQAVKAMESMTVNMPEMDFKSMGFDFDSFAKSLAAQSGFLNQLAKYDASKFLTSETLKSIENLSKQPFGNLSLLPAGVALKDIDPNGTLGIRDHFDGIFSEYNIGLPVTAFETAKGPASFRVDVDNESTVEPDARDLSESGAAFTDRVETFVAAALVKQAETQAEVSTTVLREFTQGIQEQMDLVGQQAKSSLESEPWRTWREKMGLSVGVLALLVTAGSLIFAMAAGSNSGPSAEQLEIQRQLEQQVEKSTQRITELEAKLAQLDDPASAPPAP